MWRGKSKEINAGRGPRPGKDIVTRPNTKQIERDERELAVAEARVTHDEIYEQAFPKVTESRVTVLLKRMKWQLRIKKEERVTTWTLIDNKNVQ